MLSFHYVIQFSYVSLDEIKRILEQTDYIGLPMPRPIGGCGPSWLLLGFLIVSSTERMRQAASVAAVNALIFTIAGSQTQHRILSAISSEFISTPYHCKPLWCFWRNLFRIFVASNPALSHSCL